MAEKWTDLPTVSNASLTDIVCAVQGYVSPSNIGNSVQETWQQVFNLFNQNVGQVVNSNIPLASAVSLTTSTPANVTSISLTSGDWDVFGNVFFNGVLVTDPIFACWLSTTSATIPDASNYSRSQLEGITINFTSGMVCPILRVNVASTTTVYLSADSIFGAGTVTACGNIFARRVKPFN